MKVDRGRFSKAAGIAAVLLVLGIAWGWLRRPPRDSGELIRRLWADRDVEKPNVVLITLDTTRADRLHCYGDTGARTPALAALAARGLIFSKAAVPAPLPPRVKLGRTKIG